jgi:hypothetical protein
MHDQNYRLARTTKSLKDLNQNAFTCQILRGKWFIKEIDRAITQ